MTKSGIVLNPQYLLFWKSGWVLQIQLLLNTCAVAARDFQNSNYTYTYLNFTVISRM